MNGLVLDIIGYVGSALVLVSLMMSNIYKLRLINLAGASVACFFAVMTKSYPFMVMNGCIAVIDVYYLWQMYRKRDFFSTLQIDDPHGKFMTRFIDFYREKDPVHFPQEFDIDMLTSPQMFFILRNMIPVGLIIYTEEPQGVVRIHLDYVTPDYRDMKSAAFLYKSVLKDRLADRGFTTVEAAPYNDNFELYLQKVGYVQVKGMYRKPL